MRFGVLGTGMVGQAIATRLRGLGEDVMMGARAPDNSKAAQWAGAHGGLTGDFAAAARFGDLVFNCTNGVNSMAALDSVGSDALAGKILVDIANALDFSKGAPPSLALCNTDSLGETIQRAFPDTAVVKTLCTVNADIMVDPGRLPGDHLVYVSGNDSAAKTEVTTILARFGWREIIDLGGIETARGQEMMMPLWLSLWAKLGTSQFNFALIHPGPGEE